MARAKALLSHDPLRRWTAADANDTYNIPRWGCGYFGVNEKGNLIVTPRNDGQPGAIDMKELIDELVARGIQLPILLRFSDILRARIELLCGAFNNAIREYGYNGQYRGVYPIKVNQNRTVVEEIIEFGRPFHYGLEAGSKPELLAIMAIHQDDESLIICNGYKDEEYIETALLASKMGKTVILVVEKPTELDQIHRVSERVKIKPSLGIRARLSSRGAGRWEQSGGDFSKFGLTAAEMVEAIGKLKTWNEVDTLKLLHFHLGSQISAIKSVKRAASTSSSTRWARRASRTSTSAAASASITTARRPTSRRR
jgi:arginine decarboxylase